MWIATRRNTFNNFSSSRLLIAVAKNCKIAVLQDILTKECAYFKGFFTQLALHLT